MYRVPNILASRHVHTIDADTWKQKMPARIYCSSSKTANLCNCKNWEQHVLLQLVLKLASILWPSVGHIVMCNLPPFSASSTLMKWSILNIFRCGASQARDLQLALAIRYCWVEANGVWLTMRCWSIFGNCSENTSAQPTQPHSRPYYIIITHNFRFSHCDLIVKSSTQLSLTYHPRLSLSPG